MILRSFFQIIEDVNFCLGGSCEHECRRIGTPRLPGSHAPQKALIAMRRILESYTRSSSLSTVFCITVLHSCSTTAGTLRSGSISRHPHVQRICRRKARRGLIGGSKSVLHSPTCRQTKASLFECTKQETSQRFEKVTFTADFRKRSESELSKFLSINGVSS